MRKAILALFLCLLCTLPVFGADVNADSGGGSTTADGTSSNFWNTGSYGVRVTIVEKDTVTLVGSTDFSNATTILTRYEGAIYHFGKTSKIAYMRDFNLNLSTSNYTYYALSGMPTIFSSSGSSDIDAIKTFFKREDTVRSVASVMGFDYDTLISGDYKLLIEPIAYFTYSGTCYACTAHEAALLDLATGNDLRTKLGSITAMNLPLALYLEYDDTDLGLSRWTGASTGWQSNSNILAYLGMGVISFADIEEDEPYYGEYDYEFRTDTDVIISFEITSGYEVNPDHNAYIDILVDGTTYSKAYVCPAGGTQLIWIKWHTPDEPCVVDIKVTSDEISTRMNLTANIVDIPEIEPPDPVYEDTNTGISQSTTMTDYGSVTENSWGEWTCYWVHDPDEHITIVLGIPIIWICWEEARCDCPKEHGHWEFEYTVYTAELKVEYEICPDAEVPTAYKSGGTWIMGSGYGINVNCETKVTKGIGVDDYDVTPIQNIVVLFPEFEYQTYDRLMTTDSDTTTSYSADWTLKDNRYSYYSNPVHFTPLWYPDNWNYTVGAVILDAWTPAGMLYTTVEDSVYIFSNCLADWYIHIVE